MKAKRGFLSALFVIITSSLFVTHAAPLPEDPRILKGKLDNGVTWMYRQHNNPPGKMAIEVHVRTGSLNETEAQRGLAHFMEHMAFNGTEHYPPGRLIPYFESIGMQFGPHLNAFTSYDQTVYMLFTPNTDVQQIDQALVVLSDYVFRASLLSPEIDKERGIVLEEKRRSKSAQERIRNKLWPELFEGSRFANRLVIGEDEVLRGAPKKEFDEYYRTWYRPENVTVVLVGDAPPDNIVPLIKKQFGAYKPAQPAEKPHGPEFKPFTKERAIVVTDPETAVCKVEAMNILPGRPPTVTTEQARVEMIEYVGTWIMRRRFDELVKKGKVNFRGAAAAVSDFFHDAVLVDSLAVGEPKDWAKMFEQLTVEINRAREFGFAERELALARKEILADAERAVRTEPTENAQSIINEIIQHVNDLDPIMSAQQDLDLYKNLLPGITASEVSNTFRKNFTPGTAAFVVTTPDKPDSRPPTREQVLEVAKAASKIKVEKLEDQNVRTNLMAKLPEPGKIVDQTMDKDLGITSAWLANNVRVHHRFMDYKKDTILVSISLAGGQIEETAANAGVTGVSTLAINEAATSDISSSEMRDLMTGKNIGVSAGPAGDHVMVTVSGSPLDLETGLQEAHLLLTDGKIEETAFKNWKLATLQRIEEREKIPQFKAHEAMEDLLSGGDPRRTFPGKKEVEAITREKAQAWFDRLARTAPIEVAVVGDMKLEDVMPLIQRYIGSLPKRERSTARIDALRKSPRPPGPLERRLNVETVTPQAVAYAGFAGAEGKNTSDARALELAELILSSRLVKQVREELAIVYSINAQNVPSWIYQDAGRFLSGAPCDPTNAVRVVKEVHKIFKEFADKGPTAEEMANSKKQIANTLDTGLREPSYWWSVLRDLDLQHRDLNVEKTIKEDYQAYTAEQVQNVFKKYYTPERQFQVMAFPTGGGKPEEKLLQ
jgi:zinc protease